MRSIAKILVAGAVAVPALLGTAGTAAAAGHHGHHAPSGPGFAHAKEWAGPKGAGQAFVLSGFDEHGKAFYVSGKRVAGPHGAGGEITGSHS